MPTLHKSTDARQHATAIVDALGRAIDEGIQLPGRPIPSPSGVIGLALWQIVDSEEAARQGDAARSMSMLESAQAGIAEFPLGSVSRLLLEARLELVLARRALRGGAAAVDVNRHARRVLRILAKLGNPPVETRLAGIELLATTAIMTGAYDRARRTLDEVAPLAATLGAPWDCRVQRMLGAIHARQGRPVLAAQAYELALRRLDEGAAPLEVGKLSSNLAMVSLMAGHPEAAGVAIERALRLRTEHGASLWELANSTAVLALVSERDGRPEATDHWHRAVSLARQGHDEVLTAEIELRASVAAVERGDAELGHALLRTAEARVARVGRLEPTVGAMAAEARARLSLMREDLEDARVAAKEALGAYGVIGAPFHVARMALLLGLVAERADDEPVRRRWVARACRLAVRGNFELAWREFEVEAIRTTGLAGDRDARRYCQIFGLALESAETVLLAEDSGTIEVAGRRHELGTNALPFRLARLLALAAPRCVPVSTLCQRLWPAEGHQDRTVNRLKVHIHRLREYVGRDRQCVLTGEVRRRGREMPAYCWNPEVPFRIVRKSSWRGRA